ncbi:MAG TPA: hypothetical protein VFR49_16020, partial [Solirubrobacteraceae bacterium]|nr:hypothetical protein [Solirubrobacteraceae bacterium]
MSATDATGYEARGRPAAERLVARRYARRDFYLRRLLALSDLAGVAAGLVAMLALSRDGAGLGRAGWALLSAPGWIVVFKLYGLYDRDTKRISHTTVDDVPPLFHAALAGSLLEWIYLQAVGAGTLSLWEVLLFAGLAGVAVLAGRVSVRALTARLVTPERVLVIGSGDGLLALVAKMRASPRHRLEPIGIMA